MDFPGSQESFSVCRLLSPDRVSDVHLQCVVHISEIASGRDEIVIIGDFNLPGVKWRCGSDSFPSEISKCSYMRCLFQSDQINFIVNENGRSIDICVVNTNLPSTIMLDHLH